MNFSQQNNREMGILIERSDENDRLVYDDAWKDIESILHNADDFAYVKAPPESESGNGKKDKKDSKITEAKNGKSTAYCIRTGVEIPFNINRPLSDKAFESWSKYQDEDYEEKYCHFSGEPSDGKTSYNKPILKKNWQMAKDKFGL